MIQLDSTFQPNSRFRCHYPRLSSSLSINATCPVLSIPISRQVKNFCLPSYPSPCPGAPNPEKTGTSMCELSSTVLGRPVLSQFRTPGVLDDDGEPALPSVRPEAWKNRRDTQEGFTLGRCMYKAVRTVVCTLNE